jgi:ABC-type nitrate/sulfonate/bicarbonate transport system ATPase subunit
MTTIDIELRNVTLEFPRPDGAGRLPVYEDFDLVVEQGSFTVLLGPSGCGKSTLLNVIDGLIEPTRADRLQVLGQDLRENRDVTRQCAYVFQSPRLLKWKTLRGNVEFGLKGLAVQPRERWVELIDKYFGVVGLNEFTDYYPHQVSGGMQQRAAIVRAWVNEPKILLMDEPFSHLDEITAAELRRELIKLWTRDEQRRTVVFVTHDISEAVQLGERIIMLTPRPARICYEQVVDLPWPRTEGDEQVFEIEKTLRRIFAERAGVVA